jgi:argininosuccinate synthase
MYKRGLLLYSGGLDTSVILKMLQEKMGMEVVTLTLDVGQEENDLAAIAEKAWKLGASDVITKNVRNEFANGYISKEIMADGMYDGAYPLSTSIARPLMSLEAVSAADTHDCDVIVHGCTGKGNDQVRFEVSIRALNPDLSVIAPVRDWGLNRDQEMEYASRNGIPVRLGGKYSTDENLWGRSVEGSDLEDPRKPVPADAYSWVTPPDRVPHEVREFTIKFTGGIPVEINGTRKPLSKIVADLNEIAGTAGYGAIDHLEDRVTGIKSREFYECPAASVIINAHRSLERMTLSREETAFKSLVESKWTTMTYDGLWFDPLMDHLNSFLKSINAYVSGTVSLKLQNGNLFVLGMESPYTLYNYEKSTYGKHDTFNQSYAKGFVELFGMQTVNTNSVRKKAVAEITKSL